VVTAEETISLILSSLELSFLSEDSKMSPVADSFFSFDAGISSSSFGSAD